MINELTVMPNTNLPDTIGDLARFVLFGREKLTAVRAEIRAIDKLKLADDVHKQKLEEAVILAEMVLDAEVRLGELFREIPKATNNGANQYQRASPTPVSAKQKTKAEILCDLGFSEKQAERFEILAANQNMVDYVKAEARKNNDIPTRKRVLDLVARKMSPGAGYDNYLQPHMKICKELDTIIAGINRFEITDYRMEVLLENFNGATSSGDTISYIQGARDRLTDIISELRKAEERAQKK